MKCIACSTLRLKVFTPNEKSADRSRDPPGIFVIRFQLATDPNELFRWHWAEAPAPQEHRALRIKVGQALSPGVSSSDVHSGGESPLWTVMTGTIRLGKGARREAGSEES